MLSTAKETQQRISFTAQFYYIFAYQKRTLMIEQNQIDNQLISSQLEEDQINYLPLGDQQYRTQISELISEPAFEGITMMTAQYIFQSLYQLSSYLFFKKMGVQNSTQSNAQNRLLNQPSFESYLHSMSQQFGIFDKMRNSKQTKIVTEALSVQTELIRCFQQVDQIYFQPKYFLDYSYFELFYSELRSKNPNERKKVDAQLDNLVDSLDLVEVNLFSQIHCKFHDYFSAAANFQYLHESISLQLKKLKESRERAKIVKEACVDKSVKLRKLIIQRQNIEKVLKLIKTVKSLKKLPQVMQSILASSLPYECLQLLEKTKNTLISVQSLSCLANTADSVKQMEILAQNDLSKRYASQLYLYLEECHNKDFINLEQQWNKIEMRACLDKESSLVIDQLNSSTGSALSERSQVEDQLEYINQLNEKANEQIHGEALLARHEGREYQISMILLQSYQYVNFSPQVTKIKVCNALRIFSKRFQKELMVYLNSVAANQIKNRNRKKQGIQDTDQPKVTPKAQQLNTENTTDINSQEVVDKVSVQFYVKHLGVFNDIFKQTISRFLGYLQTLLTEYEQQLHSQYQQKETDQLKLNQRHTRFKQIFAEQCSLLPSIFKIIEQKLKYLLTLKNISTITSLQFYQWISCLKYWQRYFDYIIHTNPLLNFQNQLNSPSRHKVQQLSAIVLENIKKALKMLGLKTLLYDLTAGYINAYHKNTLSNEIIITLQEDTWQSTEIPVQFSDILSAILNPEGDNTNSVSVLDGFSTSRGSISRQLSKNEVVREDNRNKSRFKILKNNILVGGVRYKVNLAFLVLCEVLEQYLKMSRILANVLPQEEIKETGYNRIIALIYEKMIDLIEQYSINCKELILETKALKFQKIKGKNINAKHICLLCNCLSVILRISQDLIEKNKIDLYRLSQNRSSLLATIQTIIGQLISKLALILNLKVEKEINDYLNIQKQTSNLSSVLTKTNNSIVTAFLHMVEITDQYLDSESIKKVLKQAFQTLTQRYFINLLLKGAKCKAQVQVLAEKIKFIRKYFTSEYDTLLKEIHA